MIIWAIKRLVVSWQKFAFFIIKAVQGQFRSNKAISYSFFGNQSESSISLPIYVIFISISFFGLQKNFEFSKIKISKYFEYLEISDFENGSGSGSESDETQKLKKVSLHICNQ